MFAVSHEFSQRFRAATSAELHFYQGNQGVGQQSQILEAAVISSSLYKHNMIRIFQAFSSLQNYKELAKTCCIQNKLPPTITTSLNLQKASTLYQQILEMYRMQPNKAENQWFKYELKLFYWVLLAESFYRKKLLQDFDQNDWLQIQNYFPSKSLLMLQYEYRKLLLKTDKDSYCLWNQKQKQTLIKLVKQNVEPYPWEDIARSLYQTLGKNSVKTSKQCREHWYNHLDPNKKHGSWQREQDLQIIRFSLKNGHKWSLLCKSVFPHRTEHMIKNRFNSILKKYKEGEMYSAANQRKILKRIAHTLEEEITQTGMVKKTKDELCPRTLNSKVTLNQVTEVKSQNRLLYKHAETHQNQAISQPFVEKSSMNYHLPSVSSQMGNNTALVDNNSLNISYNMGFNPNLVNVFAPPNYLYNYPMWQHPFYYVFSEKQ